MGVTEFACRRCGQAQKIRAPNGEEVTPGLCAACTEEEARKLEEAQREEALRKRTHDEKAAGKKH